MDYFNKDTHHHHYLSTYLLKFVNPEGLGELKYTSKCNDYIVQDVSLYIF